MNRLVENHLKFFDSVSLFADFWLKNSDLSIDFVFSSLPNQTKAILKFPVDNKEQLSLFKQHVLRHFELKKLGSPIIFSTKCIELYMSDDGDSEEIGNI